jgi:hypothetical protein
MSVTRLLFVVAREDPTRFEYIQQQFAGEPEVEIVFDRRHGDRRAARGVAIAQRPERRTGRDRRRRQVRGDLTTLGWTLVTTGPAAAVDTDEAPC